MSTWSSRYLAYCREQGHEPECMWGVDAERSPGGKGAPFMAWIGERWAEWAKLTGRPQHEHSEADHRDFDTWLASRGGNRIAEFALEAAEWEAGHREPLAAKLWVPERAPERKPRPGEQLAIAFPAAALTGGQEDSDEQPDQR